MPCYHPWTAYRLKNGDISFVERGEVVATVTLPCSQCVGCSLERARQWAVRCMHEAQLYDGKNSFVTLTYDDKHVPRDGSLRYRDFQLFMKKLRRARNAPVRFYMCGEYGEKFGRPHYHVLLFGCWFDDRLYVGKSPSGSKLYGSAELDRLWALGNTSVGDVTFESAGYVARYVMKKRQTAKLGDKAYDIINVETGEVSRRVAEFNRMSLRPGIGAKWLDRYKADVFPHGKVVVNGVECNTPRYYDKRYSERDVSGGEALAYRRDISARERFFDNTDERLAVKEHVTKAAISQLKRTI